MKVILNQDISPLGEEGDVKEVAKGYARNYLFPRGIAFPYNPQTVKIFESRKSIIEERKEQKRKDSMSLKEKLEALELSISMPAGANGRLYGAVTNQTIADELAKNGFQIERKRIELIGSGFKTVGKYKATIKLYEAQSAEIEITIVGQEIKTETHAPKQPHRRGRRDEGRKAPASEKAATDEAISSSEQAGNDAANPESTQAVNEEAIPSSAEAGTEEAIPTSTQSSAEADAPSQAEAAAAAE